MLPHPPDGTRLRDSLPLFAGGPFGGQRHRRAGEAFFPFLQLGDDGIQVVVEPRCVPLAHGEDFLDNGILEHVQIAINSSGVVSVHPMP